MRLVPPLLVLALLPPAAPGPTTYDDAGRPDPFVDPHRPAPGEPAPAASGLASMRIGEVKLQGIADFAGKPAALLLGSDGMGYVARAGDELRDGRVVEVDFASGTVVFQEEVVAPGATGRFRRVERRLAP
jgi:hypothetical protein